MNFRKPTFEDISELNHISLVSKRYWGYPEEWIQHWVEDLALTASDLNRFGVLICEFEKKIIGFCAIHDQGGYYEIMHLWLLPQYIGKGYGKKLLKRALATFVFDDKPIWVTADPNVEEFYKKQGFKNFKNIESYPKGRYLPVMKKESYFND